MSKLLFENLLKDFNKANSARKMVLAGKAGCSSVEEYKKLLEDQVAKFDKDVPKSKVKPTIHIVDIIDCSQSMTGGKIQNAINGINMGIDRLKKDEDVKYTYTLCNFSNFSNIGFQHLLSDISSVSNVSFRASGMTALNDAIGKTLNLLSEKRTNKEDKVLVNIYTDGEENDSRQFSPNDIEKLTDKYQKENFTITFIGTDRDVENVISAFKFDRSNTLKYDGSADGLIATMNTTIDARVAYKNNVLEGKNVTKGFYKNIKK